MLKRHRNQVHELVQKASLAPTEFDAVHDPEGWSLHADVQVSAAVVVQVRAL
jgi:hypothetical protein